MHSNSENTAPLHRDSLLDELLDRWKDAHDRSLKLSVDDLCQNAPELRDELSRRIAMIESDIRQTLEQGPGGSADADTEILKTISEITSLTFHAKGGLGAVYRATERELNREVAVKFIHHNLVQDRESRTRFLLEAEVTGRLEHPGIVPLYGIGQAENGRLFYYMRYIDGETMDEAILRFHQNRAASGGNSEQSLEFRRLLTAFVCVCKTVAYAHNRGIVHRDIKPANVMLGKFGETIVVDWGLATTVARDDRFRTSGEMTLMPSSGSQTSTSSGGGAGTLAYMSPEQASNLAPTPASDIYSLGATLYKILCGQPAFMGDNGHEIRERVVDGRFQKPSDHLKSIPRSLEAICLKAMKAQSKDRYATALDLASDVENYLADAPVSVLSETVGQKLARWARQHRLAAQSLGLGVAAVVLISMIAAAWLGALANSEQQAREQADSLREAAEVARRENLRTSAQFLSRSIAYEIDLRWRLLESEAQSEPLREYLLAINANPSDKALWEPLQAWINERKLLKGGALKSSGWSIFAADGTQVARAPRARSIGQNFRHRDYFHGLGYDLEKDTAETTSLKPLQYLITETQDEDLVHLSCVYRTVNGEKPVVSFAVPIWNRPSTEQSREVMGLLSISLEIEDFGLPESAMLFQVNESQLTHQTGTVIAHSELSKRRQNETLPAVSSDVVKLAEELRLRRLKSRVGDSMLNELIPDFQDPITQATSLAAIEPVIVTGRPEHIGDIGWILVVSEPAH
jgi:serine/threonine-protein kinase